MVGHEYMGTVSETVNGKKCQKWSSNTPHTISAKFSRDELFPDGSAAAAENYCRNPDMDPYGPWCFTMDPTDRWGRCVVPLCSKSSDECTNHLIFEVIKLQ